MSVFGSGLTAAVTLRQRILESLGAEEEWLEHDPGFVAWMWGPAATFFHVQPGEADTPDLGVLRIVTPVAVAADRTAACYDCDQLNRGGTVSRWIFVKTGEGDRQALAVTCSFVVGPHNLDQLTAFAIWCAREQLAEASAAIAGGVAARVGDGSLYGWGVYSGRGARPRPHEAARQDREDSGQDSAVLARHLRAAFDELRTQMIEENGAQWGLWKDAPAMTFELPLSWEEYPHGLIGRAGSDDTPPTATVETSRDDHLRAGNGLRICLRIPWRALRDFEVMVTELNTLAGDTPGASHILGAWALEDYPARDGGGTVPCYVYNLYLPAALASAGPGVDLGFVMREVLLTFARQALMARRMHGPRDGLRDDDYLRVGLDAPLEAHGLAWGETGEGRNPAALALDALYGWLVGEDADWADVRPDGFTWWPGDHAQDISMTQGDPGSPALPAILMMSDVRAEVPVTGQALTRVAEANYELGGRSALALGTNGKLWLGSRLTAGPHDERIFALHAQILAADQFVTARDLASQLDGLGDPLVSEHPFSGPRPDDQSRYGVREDSLAPLAEEARRRATPRVALIAVAGQLYPPHRIAVRGDGGLDYAYHLSPIDGDLPQDPLVLASVFLGETPAGPGWVVRTHLPLTGDLAAKADWCNGQNGALLLGSAVDGTLHLTGGWGLSPEGECCLTSWLPSYPGYSEHGQANYLLRVAADHQRAVQWALWHTEPAMVGSAPLTHAELAAGLATAAESFAHVLDYPAGHGCVVEAGPAGVVVTVAGPAPDAAFAEASGESARTVMLVPTSLNRTELAVVYAALLARSLSRVETGEAFDLVPGERPGWMFTGAQIAGALEHLSGEGVLDWPDDSDHALFPLGAGTGPGRLRIEHLPSARLHGAAALRLTGEAGGLTLADVDARDIDVIGSWSEHPGGLAYEVTIPPAGQLWNSDFAIHQVLTWTARHVIRQIQQATALTG